MEQLREKDQQISVEQILGAIPMVILLLDKESRIAYMNKPFECLALEEYKELTGINDYEAEGSRVVNPGSPLDGLVEKARQTGEDQSTIVVTRRKGAFVGKAFQVSAVQIESSTQTVVTIGEKSGPVNGKGAGNGNITTVLEAVGKICHDLNQPLQVASGSLDLALLIAEDSCKDNELIIEARNQMNNVADIARKLMNLRSELKGN